MSNKEIAPEYCPWCEGEIRLQVFGKDDQGRWVAECSECESKMIIQDISGKKIKITVEIE